MKPVELTQVVWMKIHKQIVAEYPPSVLLIRDRMRSKLGFTTRVHKEWLKEHYDYKECVYLDFFSEPKRTMFLLKYSEIINERL